MSSTFTSKYISEKAITLFFLLLTAGLQAQTSSPYSRYGLGNFQQKGSTKTRMMGGAGIGTQHPSDVNNINPSALVAMDSTTVLFDIGLHAIGSMFSENGTTQNAYSGNLDYVALMVPIHKRWFLSATIQPLTSVGYNVDTKQAYNGIANQYFDVNYRGNGGISLASVTNSFKLPYGFSIGAEYGILWGNQEETITESYPNLDISSSTRNEILYHRGNWAKAGLQFAQSIKKVSFVLGATYDIPTRITTTSERYVTVANWQIINDEDNEGSFNLPEGYGVGLSITYDKKITLAADYSEKHWSTSNAGINVGSLADNKSYSLGAEYIPNFNSNKYLDRMAYRGGVHHETGSFMVFGEAVSSSYASLGLGLPGKIKNTYINLGLELGTIGGFNSKHLSENYIKLNVSMNLAEQWFQKIKFY